MKRSSLILTAGLAATSGSALERDASFQARPAELRVDPAVTRAIHGITGVDRQRYFNICDAGQGFDKRFDPEGAIYRELVHELGVTFGRTLGPVKGWTNQLREDPDRPGFADLSEVKAHRPPEPTPAFRRDFGPNLNVAAHDHHNAYPAFLGQFFKGDSNYHGTPEWLPKNIPAAAELAAAVLKYTFSDFDRPAFFEPLNEPHWEFPKDQHLADWHLAVMEAVHRETPGVKVGGPCLSVCYFYRGNYHSFRSLREFLDRTDAQLDFYSFHCYDFFRWEESEWLGRIQSGLPLEGILDLVQNYAVNTFGKEVDIVVSEQGGYNLLPKGGDYDGDVIASQIAAAHFPGEGWEYEMKKRSIINALMLSSVIANTLTFLDHPHTVVKAVPFLLPATWSWDPHYYAQLYVPYAYKDRSRPVATHLLDYFRFFRGLQGRRVVAMCDDPDLQVRAFVDGSRLFLAVNNQSDRPETVTLSGIDMPRVTPSRGVTSP